MLIAASNKKLMSWFSEHLKKDWETVFHAGDEFNYVGLHIVRTRQDRPIRIDMSGNIKKLVLQFGKGVKESLIPAKSSILLQSGKELDPAGRKLFQSIVMSVLYPARLCHMSALFATTILATRMQAPTDDDLAHAYRLIGYLKTQVNGGFFIRGSPEPKLRVYIDASHKLHMDGKGHGCMIICMDESPIAWRAYKIPHATLSSTEDEISAVCEATTYFVWCNHLFQELRHDMPDPFDVMQDNTSAMHIMKYGGTFKRSKHMVNRYEFIMEHLRNGLFRFTHCPTDRHPADLLTKVHTSVRINELLRLLSWTAA
jgi:hypothetical protein